MNDPKMNNAPILRPTGCKVGMHVFTYAGATYAGVPTADQFQFIRCGCGLYLYPEWESQVSSSPGKQE